MTDQGEPETAGERHNRAESAAIEADLRNRRVLVTGGRGFIGHHLVPALINCGADVVTASRAVEGNAGMTHFSVDLRDASECERVLAAARPEIIYHLAASRHRTPDIRWLREAVETNLFATVNVFSAAAKMLALQTVVVLGTGEEYGTENAPAFTEAMRETPISVYSLSKLYSTQFVQFMNRVHQVPCVVLRVSLAYGPGQDEDMFLPALIRTVAANQSFKMTAGEQTRDFIYVSDVVDALLRASKCSTGQVLNIGSGLPMSIAEVAKRAASLLNREHLIDLGALEYRTSEIMASFVDNSNARRVLGWKPRVPLEEGLEITVRAYLDSARSSG